MLRPAEERPTMTHVLIIEDDVDAAESMAALIAAQNFTVAVAHSLRDARRQMALQPPDLTLLDLQLPDGSGMDLLKESDLLARAEIVLITGHASLESSIQALRLGAADYLVKPINFKQLQGILSRVTKPSVLKAELDTLQHEWERTGRFGRLWGRSLPMRRLYEQIGRVASTAVTVFITGESGSGKEVVANTVHDLSRRRKEAFLAVNCGAISPNLMESEIFGHEKGSFTGADRQHLGFFERAHRGTLFLDEVTEMPLDLQVKLLRVLETGTFMRVGSTQQMECDVRVIAATNRPPDQAVASGKLREDLLYRLNVFPVHLPPLRDRLDDVPLLAEQFLAGIGKQEGRAKRLSPQALEGLRSRRWPGNVRELRNAVQRAYVMTEGDTITAEWVLPNPGSSMPSGLPETAAPAPALPPAKLAAPVEPGPSSKVLKVAMGTSMADAERQLILATLEHYQNHKEKTAAVLGISLKTLYNRLKDYAREPFGFDETEPHGSPVVANIPGAPPDKSRSGEEAPAR